jgi:8-oxo-dGTP diphosphatase
MPLIEGPETDCTHAGGVTFREAGGGWQILLVRARPAPHDWVLPKGRIEAGETPAECARREICEEAGVDSMPLAFLGNDVYSTPKGKRVKVAFFLMRYLEDVPPTESRERRWCTFTSAYALIGFDSGRGIIAAAETSLQGLRPDVSC